MTPQEQAWLKFVKQAQEIYPPFADEKVVKAVLKSRGETTFKPEYTNKFINVLKSMVNGWQTFLKDAKEIDSELGDDKTVAKILNARGIPWYKDFDITNGLNALKDWQAEKLNSLKRWDYPCPVCGSTTKRDGKYDYMYRRECHGQGWKCSVGGYTHFHQAAWAPMRSKLVRFDPEEEKRRQQMILEGIPKEMAEVTS
jgi:hypothetical protein